MAIYTKEEQMRLIAEDWRNLKNIDNQYADVCIKAIKKDIQAIEYVKKITKRIISVAIKKHYSFLNYVKEQTEEMCLEAVKQNGYALDYVKEQTEEICLEAVKQDGCALQYVKEQTPEICLEAVKEDGYALQYVKEQTPQICLAAVKQIALALKYVKEKTPEICFYTFLNTFNLLEEYDIKDKINQYIKNNNIIINKVFFNKNMRYLKRDADFYFDDSSLEYLKQYLFQENSNNVYILCDTYNIETLKEIALSNNELIIVDEGNIKDIHRLLANKIITKEELEKGIF